jgi:hypothetical protein
MSCLYVRIPCLEYPPFFMAYLWPIRWHLLLRLLENPQFLLRAIERNGQTLAFVSTDLAMDATFVLMALRPGPDGSSQPRTYGRVDLLGCWGRVCSNGKSSEVLKYNLKF